MKKYITAIEFRVEIGIQETYGIGVKFTKKQLTKTNIGRAMNAAEKSIVKLLSEKGLLNDLG